MSRAKKILTILLVVILLILAAGGIVMMSLNSHVQQSEKGKIISITSYSDNLTAAEQKKLKKMDPQCVMVLGCGIASNTTPTPMLRDRLDIGIKMYKEGVVRKILLSGDNGSVDHNEIHVMLTYCKDKGIPREDIFCDHAGFSTYDSMYRAQLIFKVRSMVIVTQKYHMYRALYIADKMGIRVWGVSADQRKYSGQPARELREVLARDKDFFKVKMHAKPTYGGEAIPITGSGVSSHGE